MSTNGNSHAFTYMGHATPNDGYMEGAPGLTKREYFAGLALQGFIAGRYKHHQADLAEYAVECADAILAALERNP